MTKLILPYHVFMKLPPCYTERKKKNKPNYISVTINHLNTRVAAIKIFSLLRIGFGI